MPEGLHARLRKEAKLNARSVNAEIIRRLTDSFTQADLRDMIREATQATTVKAIDDALAKFKEDFGTTTRGQS
jgi:hypothetical protein